MGFCNTRHGQDEDGFQLSVVELFKTSKVLTWPRNVLVSSQFLPLAMGRRARTILRQNQIVPGDREEEEGGPVDGVVQIN